MRIICVVLLICVGGLVVADPIEDAIEDAIESKFMETFLILASMSGNMSDILYEYTSGTLDIDDMMEALKSVAIGLRFGGMGLDEFIRNVEAQR